LGALLHLAKEKRHENLDDDWLHLVPGVPRPAHALTVDETIKLEKAGMSDTTIELLIERDGSARAAGTWRTKDGWIIHTTEVREPRPYTNYDSRSSYPIFVEPNINLGRRW
jgi:hypothetical protein